MAPPLAGSPRVQGPRDYVIKAVLHGLAGPIDGKTYTQVMVPMGAQTDEWVAAVTSYIRNTFGNSGSFVSTSDVARVRAASSARKTQWTVAEIQASLPVLLPAQSTWKVTTSHNAAAAANAITLAGWNSGEPQKAGMYVQIELPEPVSVAEIQFTAAGGGRLGGGAGQAAAAQVAAGTYTAEQLAARGAGAGPETALGYPRQYLVQVSLDGQRWISVASGAGSAVTAAAFTPARAKFVRITQTGTAADAPPWVVQNLRI